MFFSENLNSFDFLKNYEETVLDNSRYKTWNNYQNCVLSFDILEAKEQEES